MFKRNFFALYELLNFKSVILIMPMYRQLMFLYLFLLMVPRYNSGVEIQFTYLVNTINNDNDIMRKSSIRMNITLIKNNTQLQKSLRVCM